MRVLVVHAHPNPQSFNATIFQTAVAALRATGHHVDAIALYEDGFVPAMTAAERRRYESEEPIIDDQVRMYAELLVRAEALVFIYPTWWFGLPAILKGWLERVFVPHVAFTFDSRGRVRPSLSNIRRVVGIATYGSPRLYVWLIGDAGRRTLLRAIRLVCAPRAKTTWVGLYGMDSSSKRQRKTFLEQVSRKLRTM